MDDSGRCRRPHGETRRVQLRAFLNGRIDLAQAEAVADLIDAATPLQAQTAFDQLEGTLSTRIAALDRSCSISIARLEASLDFPDEGFHFIEPRDVVERMSDSSPIWTRCCRTRPAAD